MRDALNSLTLPGALGGRRLNPARLSGGYRWIVEGAWDDAAPLSDEWTAAASWLILGAWDDAAPTTDATWSVPAGAPYTIWDGAEATT